MPSGAFSCFRRSTGFRFRTSSQVAGSRVRVAAIGGIPIKNEVTSQGKVKAVDFRRISALPPYAFAEIERLKLELRRSGEDVIDLGFGNPDLPSPEVAVEKLAEAAAKPRNHRYSASRGIPNLRAVICELYERRFGVALDPEREAIA